MLMSIAIPSVGWIGPWSAFAFTIGLRVWYANRSTVCAAWCHRRWSVQLRGWPSAFMFVRRKKYVCTFMCWMLNSPFTIRWRTHWWLGLKRRVCPHIAILPVRRAASTTACTSFKTSHSGISTWTCLPACRQASACAACIGVGVHRMTASTSFIRRLSERSVATCATPYLRATSSVLARSRPTSETTFTPSITFIASRCLMPKAPAPARATLMVMVSCPPIWLSVFENEMADRRVARRHVIEAVRDRRPRAAGCGVRHRAARDQPHDQLDPLAAGLAHVLDVRHLRQRRGVPDQVIEKAVVPVLVDQTRARALQLVAHAARSPDLDPQRLVVPLDRFANRPAQLEAAAARGDGVMHDVDGERNHATGPGRRLAAHQAERHRQAVVDVHLVDDGQVEVVLDHAVRDVRGELG